MSAEGNCIFRHTRELMMPYPETAVACTSIQECIDVDEHTPSTGSNVPLLLTVQLLHISSNTVQQALSSA